MAAANPKSPAKGADRIPGGGPARGSAGRAGPARPVPGRTGAGPGPKTAVPKTAVPKTAGPDPGLEIIVGLNPVRAALQKRGRACRRLLVADGRSLGGPAGEIAGLARDLGLEVAPVPRSELDLLGERHQGLALVAPPKPPAGFGEWLESMGSGGPALVLALDHVEDPHNLGALIRSAAAFGAAGVVVPKDRSAPMGRAARAASAGASESLDLVRVVNLPRALAGLKKAGFWVVAAEGGRGDPLGGFAFPRRCVLLLGSEGRGLGREAARQADLFVHVAMSPASPVDSLNVSNAGAILMHAYAASLGDGRRG